MLSNRFSTTAKSLTKHQQAVCTALFLLLAWFVPDCLAAPFIGSFLCLAFLPVFNELSRLGADDGEDSAAQTTCLKVTAAQAVYLKAFAKTARFQTTVIVAALACLLRPLREYTPLVLPPVGQDSIESLQQFSLDWILLPPLIYYLAFCISAGLRAQARTTRVDPDLSQQRQVWTAASYGLFLTAFVASIFSVVSAPNGPAAWLANWLVSSARDANLANMNMFSVQQVFLLPSSSSTEFIRTQVIPAPEIGFIAGVAQVAGVGLFLLLLPKALKLAGFLTSVCWRVVSVSPASLVEAFLETLRLPGHALVFKEKHPRLLNFARSFWWLTACYLCLFYLVGFAGGPLGQTIVKWLDFSTVNANFYKWGGGVTDFDPVTNHANLRIFLASVVALYGTVPFAVMSSVFLPFKNPRKLVINADGISFPDGPYATLWFRPFRLWHDLKGVSIGKNAKQLNDPGNAAFVFTFRSGGALNIAASQLLVKDLELLMNTIDEHAANCVVQPDVITTIDSLLRQNRDGVSSDGTVDIGSKTIEAQEFKSTVFVPLARGDWLADKRARIIRQLATKPLCAVYLARLESGNLAVVKQFYLAQDNEETRAMSKIFQRENELLRELDHPGISKVIDSYCEGSSTFLVIEHRPGTDLRSFVAEHGPRSEGVTISWAKQLCQIMIYLHGHDPVILHRDLTPDNIVVGEDGQMRLIDFGAARQFLDGITGTMIGKQCYMSPEQIRGQASPRSDVYAFGCTLNFLLTGAEPRALTQSSPATAGDVSLVLNQLIRDCTEFDEERRPADFAEVLARLNALSIVHTIKLPEKKVESVA